MSTHIERPNVVWPTLFRGAVAVVFGLLALFWPEITVLALVLAFGAFAIVDGVIALGGAFTTRSETGRARMLFGMMGVLGVIAGIIAFIWPGITAIVLAWLIAFWAIMTGALEIAAGFGSRSWDSNFGWLALISGALSVILGILIAVQPGAGAVALAWMIGALALLWGIVLILASFDVREAGSAYGREMSGEGPRPTT